MALVLGLLSVALFVAMSGLFAAAEFALPAVRRTRVEEMVHHGQKDAKALRRPWRISTAPLPRPNGGLPWSALPLSLTLWGQGSAGEGCSAAHVPGAVLSCGESPAPRDSFRIQGQWPHRGNIG
jgi:hypothetical protein